MISCNLIGCWKSREKYLCFYLQIIPNNLCTIKTLQDKLFQLWKITEKKLFETSVTLKDFGIILYLVRRSSKFTQKRVIKIIIYNCNTAFYLENISKIFFQNLLYVIFSNIIHPPVKKKKTTIIIFNLTQKIKT